MVKNQRFGDVVQYFLTIQNIIQIYHWQTKSYSRHTASGNYYETISGLIDKFIESYQGKYGRFSLDQNNSKISLMIEDNNQIIDFIKNFIKFLTNDLPKYVESTDTDLLNLRDEMLGESNKLLYLFTLE